MKRNLTTSRKISSGWHFLLAGVLFCAGVLPFHWAAGAEDEAAAELELILKAGKSALEDGLSPLAQKQFEKYFEKARRLPTEPAEAPAVMDLLLRSLYEQKKYSELLSFDERKWLRKPSVAGIPVYWRALARYEQKDYSGTLKDVDGFLKKFPQSEHHVDGRRLRAWCLLKTDQPEQAIREFSEIALLEGLTPELAAANLLDQARALISSRRMEESREVLNRLVRMPGSLEPVQHGAYWLGYVHAETREWPAAVPVLSSLGENPEAGEDLRAESLLLLASAYESLTNRVDAVRVLGKAMELARSSDLKQSAIFERGRIFMDMGRADQGIPLLKSFISSSPQDPRASRAQLRIAGVLLDSGKNQEAVDEYQYYLETFTNSVGQAQANQGKAWGLFGLGRFAESATAFMKAYEQFRDPENRERCLFKVGDAYFANGQYNLALGIYQRVLDEFAGSRQADRAFFQMAESIARTGKPAEAEGKFQELVKSYPASPLAEEALLRMAEIKSEQGRLLEAIQGYEKVMTLYPSGAFLGEALYGRGLANFRLYRFSEAIQDFDRLIKKYPVSRAAERALYQKGMCYYGLGQDTEALAVCREFMARYASSVWAPNVLFWIGECEFNRGEFEAAENDFLLFARQYPSHRRVEDALLRGGMAAARRSEYIRAIEIYTRLIKEFPNSRRIPDARFAQGEALSSLAKYSAAILVFEEIINRHHDSPLVGAAWGRKGDCQFMLGAEDPKRYEESIESFRVVANSSDVRPDLVYQAQYKMGRCLEKLKRPDDALEQYYARVIVPYMEARQKGVWHNEETKLWFTKAAFDTVAILETREEWRQMVSVLNRVVEADVPASAEAAERILRIKALYWMLFY